VNAWSAFDQFLDSPRGLIGIFRGGLSAAIIPRSAFRDDVEYQETVAKIRGWHAAATREAAAN
jgi:hypothetical protein